MADKIKSNHTVEEYSKKYHNRKHRLIKYTKKEVEDFDKKYSTSVKNYLLKDRKWWLIGDTYYEIPKAPRLTWFRNLNAGVQASCCLLAAGVVATAVTVPTVMLLNHKTVVEEHKAVIDVEIKDVTCTQKTLDNGALEITLKYDTANKEIKSLSVTMGDQILKLNSDYTFNDDKIIISKDVLDNNKTVEITIKPVLENKIGAKSIIINPTSISIEEGKSDSISVTLSDKSDPDKVQYTFDETKGVIHGIDFSEGKATIKAGNAGTDTVTFTCEGYKSATLNVTVTPEPTPGPTELTKEEWIDKFNQYYTANNKASTVYTAEDLSNFKYCGTSYDITKVTYQDLTQFGGPRMAIVANDMEEFKEGITCISGLWNANAINSLTSEIKDGGHFYILSNGDLQYYTDAEMPTDQSFLKSITMNKFGYYTEFDYQEYKSKTGTLTKGIMSVTYTGEPKEIVTPVTNTISVDSTDLIKIAKDSNVDISSVTKSVTKTDTKITIAYNNESEKNTNIIVNISSKNQSKVLMEKTQLTFAPGVSELVLDLKDAVSKVELGDTLQFSLPPVTPDPDPEKIINIDGDSVKECISALGLEATSVSAQVSDKNTLMNIKHSTILEDFEQSFNAITFDENGNQILLGTTIVSFKAGTNETNVNLEEFIKVLASGATLSFTITPVTPEDKKTAGVNYEPLIAKFGSRGSDIEIKASSSTKSISQSEPAITIAYANGNEELTVKLGIYNKDGELLEIPGYVNFSLIRQAL